MLLMMMMLLRCPVLLGLRVEAVEGYENDEVGVVVDETDDLTWPLVELFPELRNSFSWGVGNSNE